MFVQFVIDYIFIIVDVNDCTCLCELVIINVGVCIGEFVSL